MVTGVNSNYYNYYNNYQNRNGNYVQQAPNFTANPMQQTTQVQRTSEDGKDDGRISFGSKLKNLGAGALKFVTGMFTDENGNFSIGQTLKTAVIAAGIGAVCVLTAGTAVPAVLMASGIAISGLGVAKAGVQAALADTDAEAEQAWQSLGSNSVALGLSVAGARSVAKSSVAAEDAAQFNSAIKGTGNAIKHVFTESYKPVANSFNGVKDAYQGASFMDKVSGAASKFKTNVTTQAEEFGTQVGKNFNKTVYGTSSKIENEATKLADKKAKLEKQRDAITDKSSKAYKTKDAAIKRLEAQEQAIRDINATTSWEDAQVIIRQRKTEIEQLKNQASKMEKGDELTALNQKIQVKQEGLNAAKATAERKTSEVRALDSRIEALTKAKAEAKTTEKVAKLEAQINELQAQRTAANFKLPSKPEKEVTLSDLGNDQINVFKAKQKLKAANKKINDAKIAENDRLYFDAQEELINAQVELTRAQQTATNNINAFNTTPGGFKTHSAKEILNASKDILTKGEVNKHNIFIPEGNPAQWLTVGIAGRQFGETADVRFYNQLNPQEQQQFKALSYKQKQALINTYVQVA